MLTLAFALSTDAFAVAIVAADAFVLVVDVVTRDDVSAPDEPVAVELAPEPSPDRPDELDPAPLEGAGVDAVTVTVTVCGGVA